MAVRTTPDALRRRSVDPEAPGLSEPGGPVLAATATLVATAVVMALTVGAWTLAYPALKVEAAVAGIGLAVGAVLATATSVADRFRNLSAWVPALGGAAAVLGMGWLVEAPVRPVAVAAIAVGAVSGGLDLCWVGRVRAVLVFSGAALAIAVAHDRSVSWFAPPWFLAALVAHWSCTADDRAALRRAVPGGERRRPSELVVLLAAVVAVGLVLTVGVAIPTIVLRGSAPSPGLPGDGAVTFVDGVGPTTVASGATATEDEPATTTLPEGDPTDVPASPPMTTAPTVPKASGSADDTSDATATTGPGGDRRVVALAIVAVGATAGAIWLLRRRRAAAARSWAEVQVRRLERFGRTHVVRRDTPDTVVGFTERLAVEVDHGDQRLREAGILLDQALFGSEAPSAAECRSVVATIDRVTVERRRPTRSDRRRRNAERRGRSSGRGGRRGPV